jgi:DNA-binding CsgD family transcriptional regulator
MKNLIQFALQLKSAASEPQAKAILDQYLKQAGFSSYALTYYSGHVKTGRKLRYHCVSEALRPWHAYYLQEGYANVDRTLEEYYAMTLPLFWDVKEQLRDAKTKREKQIRLESIEFGIDKGLSIPIHGPKGDFVSLTLHQRLGENNLADYINQQFIWLSAAQLFYHFIKKLLDQHETPATAYPLTRREKQCLLLTSKLMRVEQIAKELKISPRTVNFHIQNANKKMGTNNKYQACFNYAANWAST